jgi:hypothetical protein
MRLLPPSPELWHALNLIHAGNHSPRKALLAVAQHCTGEDFSGSPRELEDLIGRILSTWDETDFLAAGWKGYVDHALSQEKKSLLFSNWRLLLATEPPEGFADFLKAAGEQGIAPGTVVTWLATRLAKAGVRVPRERIIALRKVPAKDLMVPRKLRELWAIEHCVAPPAPNSPEEIPLGKAVDELFGAPTGTTADNAANTATHSPVDQLQTDNPPAAKPNESATHDKQQLCGLRNAIRNASGLIDPPPATELATPDGSPTHSPDFRSARWYGTLHEFTALQAACVKVLWEARDNGTPTLGDATILEAADSDAERLGLVFRDHPAWGTMIVEGSTRGTHRLADPPQR